MVTDVAVCDDVITLASPIPVGYMHTGPKVKFPICFMCMIGVG